MCDQLSVRMIAGNESDSVAFGISSDLEKRQLSHDSDTNRITGRFE